ncbi:MAG: MFS transporter [Candidatus Lokiarchaeota archaeon]|nr:MFS transporter [Candidatus Lokiarchaeota archaeon]
MSDKEKGTLKKAFFYSFGQISDQTAYQSFILLVFTFYFAVVRIDIWLITLGYSIWSLWNMFNDPMIGYLSDRTHTKWGRRLPYMIIFFVPLAFTMYFLFTPPLPIGPANQIGNFFYFMVIIIIFELFYTAFSLNYTSLFPEVFLSKTERTKANNIRQIFTIVSLIFAFILPGFIITDYSNPSPAALPEYQLFGIIAGIIVVFGITILLLFGPRERQEFSEDYKNAFGFFKTIKFCFKSKSFRFYIIAELCNWFVFGMLPTIIPLYAKFVLLQADAFMASLLLGVAFLSATIFVTILWRPIVRRIGNRKAWMISMGTWILALAPLMFISDFTIGLIVFFLLGIGLSGSLYIIDLVVADIVDEDELSTGMRREAGYYGVNALILRFSNILVILAIATVFDTVGWKTFDAGVDPLQVAFGLRVLIFVFPAIALTIGILAIYKYPLHGERLSSVQEKLKELHGQKKARL